MSDPKENIRKVFGPVIFTDATYTVHALSKTYPSLIQVYEPFTPYEKLKPGYEPIEKLYASKTKLGVENPEDIERSIRRTKSKIRDYVLCNKFEWFVTFTFNSDRYNVDHSKAKMTNWLKNQRKRTGKFSYLTVSEFHGDKKAIHFHTVFKGYDGKFVPAIRPGTNEQLIQKHKKVYNLPAFRSGFTNATKINQDPISYSGISKYVTKYITKDMPVMFGKNRYQRSQDLELPLTEENPSDWYKRVPADKVYATENGITYIFFTHNHNLITPGSLEKDSSGLSPSGKEV